MQIEKKYYYYTWGNEPQGYVSTWYLSSTGEVIHSKPMPREKALQLNYKFDCPFL